MKVLIYILYRFSAIQTYGWIKRTLIDYNYEATFSLSLHKEPCFYKLRLKIPRSYNTWNVESIINLNLSNAMSLFFFFSIRYILSHLILSWRLWLYQSVRMNEWQKMEIQRGRFCTITFFPKCSFLTLYRMEHMSRKRIRRKTFWNTDKINKWLNSWNCEINLVNNKESWLNKLLKDWIKWLKTKRRKNCLK